MIHLNPWLETWSAALVRAAWQGGFVVAVVWAICRIAPSIPARFQSLLWRLAVLKFAIALVWRAPIELPVLAPVAIAPAPAVELSPPPAAMVGLDPAPAIDVPPAPSTSFALPQLFPAWAAVFVWQAGRILAAYRQVRRLRRECRASRDSSLRAQVEGLCRAFGVKRPPELLENDGSGSPLLIGVVRPAVVFPAATLASLDAEERRLVLAHEMGHLVRHDLFWSGCTVLVRALFWFHPLVWLAERRLHLAQEVAADDWAVARRNHDPVDYAKRLVSIVAKLAGGSRRPAWSVGISGSQYSLQRRLTAMRYIRPVSRRAVCGYVVLLVAASVAGLVPWKLTAADAPAEKKPAAGSKGTVLKDAVSKDAVSKDTVSKDAAAKSLARDSTERGRLVSFHDGLLVIDVNSGAKLEYRIPADAQSTIWNDVEVKFDPVDAHEALAKAAKGTWCIVQTSGGNVSIRIGSRQSKTIGTFVSFTENRLLMLGKNLTGSFAKKYGNNIRFNKFRDDTPIYESVDGGEYQLIGKANEVLPTVREGTVLTVHGAGDDNITRVDIGVAANP